MPDWTGLATLVAAVAAAFLSAASLVWSGRLEDRRWKREVLVHTVVSYFDASFDPVYTAAFDAQQAGGDLSSHKSRALDAHAIELRALTRLRFLAKRKVVERAFILHHIENEIYDALFKGGVRLDALQWHDLVDRRRIARTRLSMQHGGIWVSGTQCR
jgi:hypothetical protein